MITTVPVFTNARTDLQSFFSELGIADLNHTCDQPGSKAGLFVCGYGGPKLPPPLLTVSAVLRERPTCRLRFLTDRGRRRAHQARGRSRMCIPARGTGTRPFWNDFEVDESMR